MERITGKEEEIMEFFWKEGPLFVKQIWEYYDEPRPHITTLSTIVRNLEEKGYLDHRAYGNSYQYYAVIRKTSSRRRPCGMSSASISTTPIWMWFPLSSARKTSRWTN